MLYGTVLRTIENKFMPEVYNHSTPNQLIHETSPYLLQHAYNPVNWYPWGAEALKKAEAEDKVILVSIGYSACHWCHVMERESFEDIATAAIMNDHFINIKIDREERPDLDHIYMDAVQAISGSGGWPLNVFLTPDAKPFFGGTYFPPVKAFNRSSFTDVLQGVAAAWKERKHEIIAQAENLTDHINKSGSFTYQQLKLDGIDQENYFTLENAGAMYESIAKTADTVWGGFGKAPKFPQTFTIQYLLQYHHFTHNQAALKQALLSIDKMLQGGIYDHVTGGLARYSTDDEWLAPHFEKMLYDNALILLVLCDAFQISKELNYKKAITKTIDFVLHELRDAEGGFYSALDADSEGVEGKYYVWDKSEIENLLGDDAVLFCDFFDVSAQGNWEHKNILRILNPIEQFTKEKKLDLEVFENKINSCLHKLSIARIDRIKPGLDDKIILGWNALMLKGLAKAAIVLGDKTYLQHAINNYNCIINRLMVDATTGEMFHTVKNGKAKFTAFLDDYAFFIDACVQLYEATFEINYLDRAKMVCSFVCEHFSDDEKLFFYFTPGTQQDVIIRKKEVYDGAIPSGNSVMAGNLLKLSVIFDNMEWGERANKMLKAIAPAAIKYPGSFGVWASLLLQQQKGVYEIAITGPASLSMAMELSANYFIPNKIIMASASYQTELPMLKTKQSNDSTLIYVCKKYVCDSPVQTIPDLLIMLNK